MSVPLPAITVQAQFTPGIWSDISPFVRGFTVNRPSTRSQGPLLAFQAGTAAVMLDNSDGRFDPDNVNFLGGDATGFEGGLAGWIATGNCAIARSTAQAHSGTASLAATSTAAGDMGVSSGTYAGFGGTYLTYALRCLPKDTVTGSAWFRAAVSPRSVLMAIAWIDGSGAFISATSGVPVTDSVTGWTQANVQGTAPANAAYALLQGSILSTGAGGEAHYIDDAVIGHYITSSGLQVITKVFLASTTFTFPPTLAGTVMFEAWGGGGGGAGTDNKTGRGASGGGGAEYAAEPAWAASPGQTCTITIGAGGAGGAHNGNNPGSAGGSTTVTGPAGTLTAHGGSGGAASGVSGAGGTGSANTVHFNGGAGGSNGSFGTSGFVTGAGGGSSAGSAIAGNPGDAVSSTAASQGGIPADPGSGPGGAGAVYNKNGSTPASGPSGGGGGGWGSTSGSSAGGGGAQGQVRVTYTMAVPALASTAVLPMVPVQVLAAWLLNFLTGQNAGFEGGIGAWAATTNCTIAATSAQARTGTGALAVTSTSTIACQAGTADIGTPAAVIANALPVTGGQVVTGSAWFRAATTGRSVRTTFMWFSSTGLWLFTQSNGTFVNDTTSGWTQATATAVVPPGASYAVMTAWVQFPAIGEVHYVDDAVLAVAEPLYTGYADSWDETADGYNAGYSEFTLAATDAFKILAGITLAALGSPVGGLEDTGARVNRILTSAGWSVQARNVVPGNSFLQATSYGDTALNMLQLTCDCEIGQLYVDGAGNVTFRSRSAVITDPRSSTPVAVFGDLPGTVQSAGTELAYAMVSRADDDTTLANDIQATNVGGTLQEVTDPASISQFWYPRTYSRADLLLEVDTDALNWANFVLFAGKSNENRFETLTIDPLADPANLWPQVLARDIGDLIQVWRTAPGVTARVSKNCFITGITHTFDAVSGAWSTQWALQSAAKYGAFMIADNPVSGRSDYNAAAW